MNEDITQGLIEDGESNIRQMVSSCELDPTIDYGQPKFAFSQNGIGFGPLGDMQMIKAPQKNGKTFLMSLMIGAMLYGEYLGLKCEIENPRALYIDTEQHPRNTQLVYRRCCKIGRINGRERHENFRAFHFRGKSPEEIRDGLYFIIKEFKPHVVFLDGARDCIEDFNDQKESREFVTEILAQTLGNDCSLWGVIHVNPGTDKARGHLGTEWQNKCSDTLTCLKEKTPSGVIFTVEHVDARNKDINKFSFEIQDVPDEGGFLAIPVNTHISVKTKTTADETMARALAEGPLRYGDFVDKVMDVAGVKTTAAKERIKNATEAHIIEQDPVFKKFRYIGLDLENEKDCPF